METLRGPDIQPATLDDFGELQQLLHAANDYSLSVSGIQSWHDMDKTFADLHQLLESGQCFVLRDEKGAITSTVSLSEQADVWGEAGNDGQALYFYKLMKDPAKAAPQEGQVLVNFVANEAVRRQKTLVRCDTVSFQEKLVDYYLNLGFERKGEFLYQPSGKPGVFLEANAQDLIKRLDFA